VTSVLWLIEADTSKFEKNAAVGVGSLPTLSPGSNPRLVAGTRDEMKEVLAK
jgi:hypothetical protein